MLARSWCLVGYLGDVVTSRAKMANKSLKTRHDTRKQAPGGLWEGEANHSTTGGELFMYKKHMHVGGYLGDLSF